MAFQPPFGLEMHEWAWIIAGIFSVFAIVISFVIIWKHLRNYNEPRVQKYIVRVVLMIPIYTIDSYLSLLFKDFALYFNVTRDCYEAYVLFMFFRLLVEMADGEENLARQMEQVPQIKYTLPFCCFHIKPGRIFLHRCKQMILQFVVCKPILAVATFIMELANVYDDGDLSLTSGYLYISILYNISITISLYFLVLFYEATKGILASFKPISKFLCIKAVIFFSFWQGVVIAVMVYFNILIEGSGDWSTGEVSSATQNFIICLEMVPCAIAYAFTFGHKSFKRADVNQQLLDDQPKLSIMKNFKDVANIHDVIQDTQSAMLKEPERNVEALDAFLSMGPTEQKRKILHQGWLDKRGEDLAKLWKRRYAVLLNEPYGLAYFEKNPYEYSQSISEKPRGFIDFAVVTGAMPKRETSFKVMEPSRNWRFRCSSKEERDLWVKIIDHHARTWSAVEIE